MASSVEIARGVPEAGRDFIQALERGLAVIQAFDREHPELTLSDVARRTKVTRATARRILLTLQQLGFVSSDGRRFRLRPRVLTLGYAYLSSLNLGEIAEPYMQELAETVHESSSVAVLDGIEIVYVVRMPTTRIMTIGLAVGSRLPAYATSMGRVLLADLPPAELAEYFREVRFQPLTARTVTSERLLREILWEVRGKGWALVDQELEEGVRSVAAPLKDGRGRTVAAINVSAHAGRVTLAVLSDQFLPALQRTAAEISEALQRR